MIYNDSYSYITHRTGIVIESQVHINVTVFQCKPSVR